MKLAAICLFTTLLAAAAILIFNARHDASGTPPALCGVMEPGRPSELDSLASAGEHLFNASCTPCHAIHERVVGPALYGVSRRHSEQWLLRFIRNSQAMIRSGDQEAVRVFHENGKAVMTSFENLSNNEIKAILHYIDAFRVVQP